MGLSRPKNDSSDSRDEQRPLESLIADLTGLPPLPQQTQALLMSLADPELDIPHLIGQLEQTPPLAARLLGIARSAFFAGPIPARDISDAVIRVLGLQLVRDLGICFLLSSPLNADQCPAYRPEHYWRHAVLTASLARELAPAMPGGDTEAFANAYLCGLLHNLGLPALVHVAPVLMSKVLTANEQQAELPLADIERLFLGLDHCAAGELLAQAWHLPADVAAVMTHHRDPLFRGEYHRIASLTGLAERFCKHVEQTPEADFSYARLGIDARDWERITASWLSRFDDIVDLSRMFG